MTRSPFATATRIGAVVVSLVATLVGTGASAAGPPTVQALPTPKAFVSYLDLECFRTPQYVPPTTTVVTQHLNPVLAGLPTEAHVLGPREQLCVPVAKNGVIPPPGVLEFVRYVDLSCYRIQGQTVSFPLTLRHLNPVLSTLPPKNTAIGIPEQLCVPVIKNNVVPPAETLSLVRYIDLKCYRVGNMTTLGVGLQLSQLNPVLGTIPPVAVTVLNARQLCVPVRKNNQAIPAAVLDIVRWVDLEKYDITVHTLATPRTLTLTHINPLLVNLPPETVTIQSAPQLMLPVSKNGAIPPG